MIQRSHHLYVHVPFCRLVCAYCDFVTVGGRAEDIPRYVSALRRELAARPAPGQLRTIYFGGGTPSLLTGAQAGTIISDARDRWERADVEEITLEANPSQREAPDWTGLRDAGVTRISLGVQSLRDPDLVALARGHTADEARRAFASVRGAGFDDVSVDLIYGIPGQSLADWRDGLERAVDLRPDHLSCYALQLALTPDEWAAPPRAGALRWRGKMVPRQDDALAGEQYHLAEELLDRAGYGHYELSSWARPGHESRHNNAYWARSAYTGIGAGAHSYDGAAERSWNVRDLDRYLETAEAGKRPVADREILDGPTREFEALALGLRRVDGIDRAPLQAELGTEALARFDQPIGEMEKAGLIEVDPVRLRLTPAGRLLANEVLVALLPEPVPRR